MKINNMTLTQLAALKEEISKREALLKDEDLNNKLRNLLPTLRTAGSHDIVEGEINIKVTAHITYSEDDNRFYTKYEFNGYKYWPNAMIPVHTLIAKDFSDRVVAVEDKKQKAYNNLMLTIDSLDGSNVALLEILNDMNNEV